MTTQVSNASPSVGTAVTDLLTLPSNAAGTATFFICGPAPLTTPASATTGCPTGGNQVRRARGHYRHQRDVSAVHADNRWLLLLPRAVHAERIFTVLIRRTHQRHDRVLHRGRRST